MRILSVSASIEPNVLYDWRLLVVIYVTSETLLLHSGCAEERRVFDNPFNLLLHKQFSFVKSGSSALQQNFELYFEGSHLL